MELPREYEYDTPYGPFSKTAMNKIIDNVRQYAQAQDNDNPVLFVSLHEQDFTQDFVVWLQENVNEKNIQLKTITDAFKQNVPALDISDNLLTNRKLPLSSPNNFTYYKYLSNARYISVYGNQSGPIMSDPSSCTSVPSELIPQNKPDNIPENKNKCKYKINGTCIFDCVWIIFKYIEIWGPILGP